MLFHDPDTLQLWIDVFLTLVGVSVAFALVTFAIVVRGARRPAPAALVAVPRPTEVASGPAHRAA